MDTVKIVIVEDHVMFSEFVQKVCKKELDYVVVGTACDGRAAVKIVIEQRPDLVLLDLQLPKLDGFGVVEAIRLAMPEIRVLVLSSHCDAYTVFRAQQVHVQGFVDKNFADIATLKRAIAKVASGKVYFSDEFQKVKHAREADPFAFDKVLTDRERVVLGLIGQPMTDVEIAARLGISWQTVEKHRFRLLRKLNLSSNAELVRYAQEHGFTLSVRAEQAKTMLP